jgi:hypothetical protein
MVAARDIGDGGYGTEKKIMYSIGNSALVASGAKVMPVDQSHAVYYGICINRLQLIDDGRMFRQTHKGVVCY